MSLVLEFNLLKIKFNLMKVIHNKQELYFHHVCNPEIQVDWQQKKVNQNVVKKYPQE